MFKFEFLPGERAFLRGAEAESKPASFSLSPRLIIYILLFGWYCARRARHYLFIRAAENIIYIYLYTYTRRSVLSLCESSICFASVFSLRRGWVGVGGGGGCLFDTSMFARRRNNKMKNSIVVCVCAALAIKLCNQKKKKICFWLGEHADEQKWLLAPRSQSDVIILKIWLITSIR